MKNFYQNADTPPAIAFEDTVPTGFSLVPDGALLDQLWATKGEERKEAGQAYFTKFQTDLYRGITSSTYTEVQVQHFREYTKELADLIKEGSWTLAKEYCFSLPVSGNAPDGNPGIFDTTKKSEIQAYVDNYVLNNY